MRIASGAGIAMSEGSCHRLTHDQTASFLERRDTRGVDDWTMAFVYRGIVFGAEVSRVNDIFESWLKNFLGLQNYAK